MMNAKLRAITAILASISFATMAYLFIHAFWQIPVESTWFTFFVLCGGILLTIPTFVLGVLLLCQKGKTAADIVVGIVAILIALIPLVYFIGNYIYMLETIKELSQIEPYG